jgi:acyl carrier protein
MVTVTMTMEEDVLEEVRRIARAELAFEGNVDPSSRLKEDLELDSMSMIIVAVGLENRFRVRLEEEDAGVLTTVADLIDLVARRRGEQGALRG